MIAVIRNAADGGPAPQASPPPGIFGKKRNGALRVGFAFGDDLLGNACKAQIDRGRNQPPMRPSARGEIDHGRPGRKEHPSARDRQGEAAPAFGAGGVDEF